MSTIARTDAVTLTKEEGLPDPITGNPTFTWNAHVQIMDKTGMAHIFHGQGRTADEADHDLVRHVKMEADRHWQGVLPEGI